MTRAADQSEARLGGRRPTKPLPLAPGPRKPGADTFLNYGPLEFGKHAHHLEQGLTRRATSQVTALVQALSNADLKGGTFIVAGYTDAKGSETYNQGLSERRADAVKRFLLEQYGIEAGNLVTVGYGKTHLKNAAEPFSGENRRVQVVNATDK